LVLYVKKLFQRSIDANSLLSSENAILRAELNKTRTSSSIANTSRNGKSLLGTKGSVLSPISANRKMVDRRDADSKKLKRIKANHAKELEGHRRV
jgi:hypothetical protein